MVLRIKRTLVNIPLLMLLIPMALLGIIELIFEHIADLFYKMFNIIKNISYYLLQQLEILSITLHTKFKTGHSKYDMNEIKRIKEETISKSPYIILVFYERPEIEDFK
jgi:hypothetical protein